MDMFTIFDAILFVFGIYMIGAGYKMKRTGNLSSVIIAKEELPKCKDKAGMIAFIYWREMLFGAIFVLAGALGLVNDLWIDLGVLNIIELVVFLAAFIWFQRSLAIARREFFRVM